MKTKRQYTKEFKEEAVQLAERSPRGPVAVKVRHPGI